MTKSNWWMDYGPVPEVRTVHEQEKTEAPIVYDSSGQPYVSAETANGLRSFG